MEKFKKDERFTYATAEDFRLKARSKKDLYFLFTQQCNIKINDLLVNLVLPSFREWTVSFLTGILAEENEVSFNEYSEYRWYWLVIHASSTCQSFHN